MLRSPGLTAGRAGSCCLATGREGPCGFVATGRAGAAGPSFLGVDSGRSSDWRDAGRQIAGRKLADCCCDCDCPGTDAGAVPIIDMALPVVGGLEVDATGLAGAVLAASPPMILSNLLLARGGPLDVRPLPAIPPLQSILFGLVWVANQCTVRGRLERVGV